MGGLTIGETGINRTIGRKKPSFLKQAFAQFTPEFFRTEIDLLETLSRARFEWCLVAFAGGIAAYFAWSHEPRFAFVVAAFCLGLTCLVAVRAKPRLYEICLLLIFIIAGFGRAVLHTKAVAAPILPEFRRAYTVSGWVENVQASGKLQHFYIRVRKVDELSAENTPVRVRIRMKPYEFKPGDSIRIKALMTAPPEPAIVGGYDGARASFFRGIGGTGFAISKPQSTHIEPLGTLQGAQRKLVQFRFSLSRRIQARAPPDTAGLQAALLTGDRSGIKPAQAEALRTAGLAHLLAISGLHMGLLAGGAYFFASFVLASVGPIARRYDMRKWAAVLGIFVATFYLLISGASVSTTRAFIMAVIVFMAVILNRRAVSMRSVALAAAITLLLHPESLLSAGFQMSFSATAALVAVYRAWADRRITAPRRNILGRLWGGFIGLSLTSLVAGLATGVFAALNFHRFARYGLLGNILAMPVFTLVVMPAGFVAILVMPLGLNLERWPLLVMGLGLDYVLIVANWVSSIPRALLYIKSANGFVLCVFSLGFVCLCLGPANIRLFAIVLITISFVSWARIEQPDMRISAEARIAFWHPHEVNVLSVDRVRGDGFGRDRFAEQAGVGQMQRRSYQDADAPCDMTACRIALKGKSISIVTSPEGVVSACTDSDLVVLTVREAGPRAKRQCGEISVIDAFNLATDGALDVFIKGDEIIIRKANPKTRKARPWG